MRLDGELKHLESARRNLLYVAPEKYSKLVRRCGKTGYYTVRYIFDSRLEQDNGLSALETLLDKNLHGIDLGIPELAKKIRNQGILVEVEPYTSVHERVIKYAGILGLSLIGILIGKSFYNLRNE
jgi:hypothetical protein